LHLNVAMGPRELNDISYLIIQSAIQVHRELGPGLLESIYRACLLYELRQRALTVIAEQLVPICYRGVLFEGAYRLDLLVEDQVVVEVKAIERTLPVHSAQLLSYLRLLNKPLGLLINFHVPVLVAGVDRLMNGRHADALRTKSLVSPDHEPQRSKAP
jgi:GxxExxY protein